MSECALNKALTSLQPGHVQTFLCGSAVDALGQLLSADWEPVHNCRVVTQTWKQLPEQAQMIEDIVATLAEVAFELWPDWYQPGSFVSSDNTATDALLNRYSALALQEKLEGLCQPWLKAALRAHQKGKIPVLKAFPHGLQLAQLSLAIDPACLVLAIVIEDTAPLEHRLLGLAKAVSWLADQSQARIALFISEDLSTASELDSVLYGANRFASTAASVASPQAVEAKHTVFPIHGKPHPFSPGEQKLAEWLAKDTELATLFHFNQSVKTVKLSPYIVDLLWAEGRVVVEIDGYRHHGNQFGFAQDRQRDYELLISGYVVLRLPHDQVMADVEVAVEKIRDVVRYRRRQLSLPTDFANRH
ncbi:DUF559 domain-containing protein [Romeria aff. gracilis LEGE 07310]|uniref:DUF559 domain-containing protein n=1 Tax=Vasconcelosia minhoensis LEGE 07310 TaxID=915328 RepID=A0A8J7AYA9_9CYAN|nr:DUF559 domain-containing protein [Romeria gracilis]MBE9078462.1 DUF559 domain-containing protein [Romeria aff. gracilis LEGE 07310]